MGGGKSATDPGDEVAQSSLAARRRPISPSISLPGCGEEGVRYQRLRLRLPPFWARLSLEEPLEAEAVLEIYR